MSAAVPNMRGNPLPRWSVDKASGLLPASMAGLPARSACVRVGPPSKAIGARCGSVPVTFPAPVSEMLQVTQIASTS
jgi:hypothetical protein